MTETLQEVNCEKCGLVARGLTEEQGATFARAHLLEHEQAGKSVIVTVEDEDPFENCPPWGGPFPSLVLQLDPYVPALRRGQVVCQLCQVTILYDQIPQHEQGNKRHARRVKA